MSCHLCRMLCVAGMPGMSVPVGSCSCFRTSCATCLKCYFRYHNRLNPALASLVTIPYSNTLILHPGSPRAVCECLSVFVSFCMPEIQVLLLPLAATRSHWTGHEAASRKLDERAGYGSDRPAQPVLDTRGCTGALQTDLRRSTQSAATTRSAHAGRLHQAWVGNSSGC